MSPDTSNDRLEELERRFNADPSSRVFVQLADGYRRQGRVSEAIEILEKGLENQPNYVSAQVALSRCRLAAEDPEGAAELLEKVLEHDATHLLANKLLVEAYLATGRTGMARERLQLYGLINAGDAEIASLQQRIDEAAEHGGETAETAETAEMAETDETADLTPAESMAAEPLPELPEEEPPEVELREVEPPEEEPSVSAPLTESPMAQPATEVHPAADPFGSLWTQADHRSWTERFDREGIFPLPEVLAPEPPAQAAEALSELEDFGEPESAEALPREEEVEERAATVTLGQLYLAQGHDSEAERIFRKVLERDPSNRISRDALEQLAARRGATAQPQVDVGARAEGNGERPEGLTARKVAALQAYLERLRWAVSRDVS